MHELLLYRTLAAGADSKLDRDHRDAKSCELCDSAAQPFFGVCDTHHPLALTALPGNNWQGPKPLEAPE